jgi:hypothetical protein
LLRNHIESLSDGGFALQKQHFPRGCISLYTRIKKTIANHVSLSLSLYLSFLSFMLSSLHSFTLSLSLSLSLALSLSLSLSLSLALSLSHSLSLSFFSVLHCCYKRIASHRISLDRQSNSSSRSPTCTFQSHVALAGSSVRNLQHPLRPYGHNAEGLWLVSVHLLL